MPTSAPDSVVAPRSARPGRLHRTQDYARVQGVARRIHGAILLLLVAHSEASSSRVGRTTRVGLTVSRKVGGAVVRNRVKRWLREAVRAVGAPAGGPWDLVLVARADAATAGYTAVEAQVRHLFHRELPARMGRAGGAVP